MRKIILVLIKFYQVCLSPLKKPCCRFFPTCSDYAYESVKRFGVIKGIWFSLKRFLKCNPFYPGGYDPVPDKKL